MAKLQFQYKVTIQVDEKDLLKVNEFLEMVQALDGKAELQKTTVARD